MDRRNLLKRVGITVLGLPFTHSSLFANNTRDGWDEAFSEERFSDEAFWKKFKKQYYDISKDFINLENGYFGVQSIPVQKAYFQHIKMINEYSSQYLRGNYPKDFQRIIELLAQFSKVEKEELLITRNATESMNIIIQGLDLKKGDEVILNKQDYFSMIEAFEMLEKKIGINIKVIRIPLLPKSDEEIIQRYEEAVTPKTKCILTTHMIHLTGQIIPIKKIVDRFKPKGINVIVDAAHSFAQIEFGLKDLGADFVGVNLHKWFGNPLGAGLLYVKRSRIKDLKPLFGDSGKDVDDIRKLGHFGTLSVPTILTITEAKAFNDMVTMPLKEKRLRYLQNYWTNEAGNIDRVKVTTPRDPNRSCAIASFAIDGVNTTDVVKGLYEKQNVFTVIRHLENQDIVRVTPTLYNNTKELDVLLEGIAELART